MERQRNLEAGGSGGDGDGEGVKRTKTSGELTRKLDHHFTRLAGPGMYPDSKELEFLANAVSLELLCPINSAHLEDYFHNKRNGIPDRSGLELDNVFSGWATGGRDVKRLVRQALLPWVCKTLQRNILDDDLLDFFRTKYMDAHARADPSTITGAGASAVLVPDQNDTGYVTQSMEYQPAEARVETPNRSIIPPQESTGPPPALTLPPRGYESWIKCPECSKTCENRSTWHRHKLNHWYTKYICPLCHLKFQKDNGYYICWLRADPIDKGVRCKKRFKDGEEAMDHVLDCMQTRPDMWRFFHCNRNGWRRWPRSKHKKPHSSDVCVRRRKHLTTRHHDILQQIPRERVKETLLDEFKLEFLQDKANCVVCNIDYLEPKKLEAHFEQVHWRTRKGDEAANFNEDDDDDDEDDDDNNDNNDNNDNDDNDGSNESNRGDGSNYDNDADDGNTDNDVYDGNTDNVTNAGDCCDDVSLTNHLHLSQRDLNIGLSCSCQQLTKLGDGSSSEGVAGTPTRSQHDRRSSIPGAEEPTGGSEVCDILRTYAKSGADVIVNDPILATPPSVDPQELQKGYYFGCGSRFGDELPREPSIDIYDHDVGDDHDDEDSVSLSDVHVGCGPANLLHLGHLGKGATGVVESIWDPKHPDELAMKSIGLLHPHFPSKLLHWQVRREVQALTRLHHNHVVSLVGCYARAGSMELLIRPSATDNLMNFLWVGEKARKQTPEPVKRPSTMVDQVAKWASCLSSAVYYVHSAGMTHGDIKPNNILLKGTHLYLGDFGLAEFVTRGTPEPGLPSSQNRWGTRLYSPPEVNETICRNPAADIWSLGCVLFEMSVWMAGYPASALRVYGRRSGNPKRPSALEPQPYHHDYASKLKWIQRLQHRFALQESLRHKTYILDTVLATLVLEPDRRITAAQASARLTPQSRWEGACCCDEQLPAQGESELGVWPSGNMGTLEETEAAVVYAMAEGH